MRRFTVTLVVLLSLSACMPTTPVQRLPVDCRTEKQKKQLVAPNWLTQTGVWRLRQSTLLEAGGRTIPLEGFLRLDLNNNEARLVAMNSVGLVLFDLSVTPKNQQLKRAVPQLQRMNGLAAGVAQSLRQIFFQTQPHVSNTIENFTNLKQVEHPVAGGVIRFTYDCRGDLRRIRQEAATGDWRVAYNHYQQHDGQRLPEEIVMNDYRHRLKLSLWISAARQE